MGSHKPLTAEELDASWIGTSNASHDCKSKDELVRVECVRVDIRQPKGRISIVLTFSEVSEPYREVTSWFNVEKVRGKNVRGECKMLKDSKLARLYRVTIGKEPSRLNRARQCANHFIGKEFYVKPVSKKERGLESSYICPVNPIKSRFWSDTGKSYQRPRVIKSQVGQRLNGQLVGNKRANSGQLSGNVWAKDLSPEHDTRGPERFSTTINQLAINKVPFATVVNTNFESPVKDVVTEHKQEKGESLLEYYGRVIESTW